MFWPKNKINAGEIELTPILDKRKPQLAITDEKKIAKPQLTSTQKKINRLKASKKGRSYLSVISLVKADRFTEIVDYYFDHRNTPKAGALMRLMTSPALLRFWFMVLMQENGLKACYENSPAAAWPGLHPFKQLLGQRLSVLAGLSMGITTQLRMVLNQPDAKKSIEKIDLLRSLTTARFITSIKAKNTEEVTDEFYKNVREVYVKHLYLLDQYVKLAEPWSFNAMVCYLVAKVGELGALAGQKKIVPDAKIQELMIYAKTMVIRYPFSGSFFAFAMFNNEVAGYYYMLSSQGIVSHMELTRSQAPGASVALHNSSQNLPLATAEDYKRDDYMLDAVYVFKKASLLYDKDPSDFKKRLAFSDKGAFKDCLLCMADDDLHGMSVVESEYQKFKKHAETYVAKETIEQVRMQAVSSSRPFRR